MQRAVRILQKRLTGLVGIHAVRRALLWAVVGALVTKQRLGLTCLGRALERSTSAKHRIKAVDRLLGNQRFHRDVERIWCSVSTLLLRSKRPTILIDETETAQQYVILTAAVPLQGRSAPFLAVSRRKKGRRRLCENRFLRLLEDVVPPGCRPTLVTDAGFEGPWFRRVRDKGWDYVGRLRQRTNVRKPSEPWQSHRALFPKSSRVPQDLGAFEISEGNPYQSRLVLFKGKPKKRTRRNLRGKKRRSAKDNASRKRAREPWLLVTSLESPAKEIVTTYKKRMQIEETFRDLKSHRLGWSFEDVRTNSLHRLEALLAIAAVAYLAVILVGIAAEANERQRQHQANTIRDRRVLSIFYLGCIETAGPCSWLTARDVHRSLKALTAITAGLEA